ncbi:MAG TPA: GIY-YIG nuclease family protein [Lacunisphaera sp.]
MYRVYILRNPSGRYYIGLSANVPLRLEQHNEGISKWTAKYRPWNLAWQSETLPENSKPI